ncbi:MAG: hypothetical protein IKN73_00665 [Alphaproteobacteria bacterium]|nr:hypothetical protein [Alphaproteobacteria bacterium]
MKITCDFCKTEYNLDKIPSVPVKCAVCGHTWMAPKPFYQKSWLKFIAALTALMSACVFVFVVIITFNNDNYKKQTLSAGIDEEFVRVIKDKDGANRLFVAGHITNNTDEIYGLPNLIIISYDANNNVISRQTFMPPATLLESKNTIVFNYILSVEPTNVKRVAVELKGIK